MRGKGLLPENQTGDVISNAASVLIVYATTSAEGSTTYMLMTVNEHIIGRTGGVMFCC